MIMAAKRSVIMQIENVVNKNIDARNGNAQTERVGISDYIRDDVKSDCEKRPPQSVLQIQWICQTLYMESHRIRRIQRIKI